MMVEAACIAMETPSDHDDSFSSEISSGSDQDVFHPYDLDLDENGDTNEAPSINHKLECDIASVKQVFGESAVEMRLFNDLDIVDVDLKLDVSCLDEDLANAWKVNKHEPIVIRLTVSVAHYMEVKDPDVVVFQRSFQDGFGLGRQLQKVVSKFITHKHQLDRLMETSKTTSMAEKNSHGFLVEVLRHIQRRLSTINEYCVICDEAHVFQNGPMLKPSVCSRELCVFAFQQLGVMSEAVQDIASGTDVVMLLIAMAQAACSSKRRNSIFDPYPTVVNPTNLKEFAFHPKDKNFQRVEDTLQHLRNFKQMAGLSVTAVKQQLNERDPLAFPLLQWIVASNRSHIVKIGKNKQLDLMCTPHQYLLLSCAPSREAMFQEAKKLHGSVFAFHGSSLENWHSIMRNGLVDATGTKKEVNGSKYGNGVYLSPMLNVSSGYSRMGKGIHSIKLAKSDDNKTPPSHERFLQNSQLTCIALCEVVDSPDLKKHQNIWVCRKSEYVCTRFFFVYEDGAVGHYSIDTREGSLHQEILQALEYRNH